VKKFHFEVRKMNNKIQDYKEYSPHEKCPHCGGLTKNGFGLAGGGYGPYTYCEKCEVITSKSADET
jgi:hypothetical protein